MKLKCPKCNHAGNYPPGIFFKCDHCHISLQLLSDNVIQTYTYAPKIQSPEIGGLIKNHLADFHFHEEVRIVDVTPVYLPFWQSENRDFFIRASSKFTLEGIKMPAERPIHLNQDDMDSLIELAEIETVPAKIKEEAIFYVPVFKVKLSYRDTLFPFYVNAISGDVFGERIPYVSIENSLRLFPLFVSLFISLIAFGLIFKPIFIAMPLSFVALFLFYQLSTSVFSGENTKK